MLHITGTLKGTPRVTAISVMRQNAKYSERGKSFPFITAWSGNGPPPRSCGCLLRNSRRGVQHHQPTPIPFFVHVGREGREAHGIPILGLPLNTLNSDNPPHVLREMDLRL